jgi:hypothetical protein
MGISYTDVPVKKTAAVVHPGHPPIIDTGLLADNEAKFKAGTVLKMDANGKLLAAAPADTPVAVLTKDSDGKNAEVLVLWHGAVVFGRLLDASGANPVAATEALANKLRAAGIYPLQLFSSAKKGVY